MPRNRMNECLKDILTEAVIAKLKEKKIEILRYKVLIYLQGNSGDKEELEQQEITQQEADIIDITMREVLRKSFSNT